MNLNERRSTEQNSKMWPLLTDISNQLEWKVNGYKTKISPEDWKHILSAGFKKEQRIAEGIDGGFVILGQHTSKFNKNEMAMFIELIYAFGAEHGIKWTDEE